MFKFFTGPWTKSVVWLFRWKPLSELHFPAMLSMLYKRFYLLRLSMKSWSVTIQMKTTEQYFPVVLFIMLYKVVLTFESVDEILWCDHSNESSWAVLSCGTVYYVVQGGSNVWVCGWNLKVWLFKWKLLSSTLLWYCYYTVQSSSNVWVLNEIITLDHPNESFWAVLSCGAVYYAA